MRKDLRKRLIITASFCCLFTLMLAVPTSSGYGTSFSSATTITNGVTNESLLTTADVYYKICCVVGDNLYVVLTWYSGNDLDLRIQDPTKSTVDSSSNIGTDDTCSETCQRSGWYFIEVDYYSGGIPALITLTVTGATGNVCTLGIPGFELISTLFGLMAATFLAVFLLKGRKLILK